MIGHRTYHPDGVACHDPGSCWGREHTNIPPRCAAEPATELARGLVVCDLPQGHPGPHLHVATKLEFIESVNKPAEQGPAAAISHQTTLPPAAEG